MAVFCFYQSFFGVSLSAWWNLIIIKQKKKRKQFVLLHSNLVSARRCNPGARCLHYSVMVMMKMMLTVEHLHLFTAQNQEVVIFHVSLTGKSALGRCTWPRFSNTVKCWSWSRQWDAKENGRGFLWDRLRFSSLCSLLLLPHSVLRVQEVVTWSPPASPLTEVLYHQ